MTAEQTGNDILISGAEHYDIYKTFSSGQTFRFSRDGMCLSGAAFGRVLELYQHEDAITLKNCTSEEYESIWKEYFAADLDYGRILKAIDNDEIIHNAIKSGSGIRILRQELWECIISFVLSQNSNIPRISKMVEALCSSCGTKIPSSSLFAFPSPEQILKFGKNSLGNLKLGYRDEYVYEAAKAVCERKLDTEKLRAADTQTARKMLTDIKGIGGKVADCILLFGLGRYEVCPHDVWIKRILSEKYGIADVNEKKGYQFVSEKWGEYAGIAQQFLFYAHRGQKNENSSSNSRI